MTTITRTGQLNERDSSDYSWPSVGDAVDDAWFHYLLEVVPPAFMSNCLLQLGEPGDHDGLNGTARYETLQRHSDAWIYTGRQVRGHFSKIEALS